MDTQNNKGRTLKGVVTSNKMTKTVVVAITSLKLHPKYHKRYKVSKKYPSHTEIEVAVGDKVVIEETRPLSKEKRWLVISKA